MAKTKPGANQTNIECSQAVPPSNLNVNSTCLSFGAGWSACTPFSAAPRMHGCECVNSTRLTPAALKILNTIIQIEKTCQRQVHRRHIELASTLTAVDVDRMLAAYASWATRAGGRAACTLTGTRLNSILFGGKQRAKQNG
jgi:hypothetical protein